MKMVYSRQNDFRLLNRIAKGDTLVVKAYGWDKKPFFKQEVSGLHTIKEAIGLVRANNSAEIVGCQFTTKRLITRLCFLLTSILATRNRFCCVWKNIVRSII